MASLIFRSLSMCAAVVAALMAYTRGAKSETNLPPHLHALGLAVGYYVGMAIGWAIMLLCIVAVAVIWEALA